MLSKDKFSESDTSQIEEIKMTSNETDNDIIEESIASASPGIQKSSETSIPEEYGEDTFESPSGTRSQSKKMTSVSEAALSLSVQGRTKKRQSKESDESKSEEEVSLAGKRLGLTSRVTNRGARGQIAPWARGLGTS